MATALGALGETTVEINDLKPKVDMQMMYCSVCKIFLNSSLQADAHFAGKSHKSKAKSVCSEGSPPTDTLAMAKVTENSQFYRCDVCEKYFNSSLQLQDHMHGKAHQHMAQKRLETNSGVSAHLRTFVSGAKNLENMNSGNLYPEISNQGTLKPFSYALPMGTLTPKTETYNGIKKSEMMVVQDIKNELFTPVDEVTNVGKNLSELFCCKMCNITLNSKKQLEQHNNGLRHKIIIGKANPPSVSGEKWENVRYMKISNAILGINKDTATGSGGGMNIREYHCEKCDITVNSQTQLDQHLQSNKHKMKDVQPANNSQKKRKRPATGHGDGQNTQWNSKRPNHRCVPLANNFVTSNTYIPAGGGKPVYWLPPVPKQYRPQNTGSQN